MTLAKTLNVAFGATTVFGWLFLAGHMIGPQSARAESSFQRDMDEMHEDAERDMDEMEDEDEDRREDAAAARQQEIEQERQQYQEQRDEQEQQLDEAQSRIDDLDRQQEEREADPFRDDPN